MSGKFTERQVAAVRAIAKDGQQVIGKAIAVSTAHELVRLGLLVRAFATHHTGWWSEGELSEQGRSLALSMEE